MYEKSQVWMKNAYSNLEESKKASTLEDAYFEIALFNTQQAIEFILKAVLLEYGVEFETKGNQGHNIQNLVELIREKTNFMFERQEDLELLASTITFWEASSRYKTGISVKIDTVQRVLNIYKEIEKNLMKCF